MDYTHATGNIGNYKGTVVHAMTKAEYFSYKQYSNNMIYLITDDNLKLVRNGNVIGRLSVAGEVTEADTLIEYREKKPVKEEPVAADLEVEDTDKFFKDLDMDLDKFLEDNLATGDIKIG
jgi:hypothetical protein